MTKQSTESPKSFIFACLFAFVDCFESADADSRNNEMGCDFVDLQVWVGASHRHFVVFATLTLPRNDAIFYANPKNTTTKAPFFTNLPQISRFLHIN